MTNPNDEWEKEFDDNFPEGERRGFNSYPYPLTANERESLKDFTRSLLAAHDAELVRSIEEKRMDLKLYWGTERLKAAGYDFALDEVLSIIRKESI